jgi:hypothetical protein
MFDERLSALRAQGDALESRKVKLLDTFIPFRDGFVAALHQFTEAAMRQSLRGVKICKKTKIADSVLEFACSLNDIDLIFVVRQDIYLLERDSGKSSALAARIIIYPEGDEECTPLGDIVVQETATETFGCLITFLTTQGTRCIMGEREITPQLPEEVAEVLINHFYAYGTVWQDWPTRRVALGGKGIHGPIGFKPKTDA